MTQTTQRNQPRSNGGAPVKVEVTTEQLAAAAEHEEQILTEANEIWAAHDGEEITPRLWRQLRPLLRRPIPDGYISEVTEGKGKPYPSKGIKSLQVQIDRLDNVLGEGNWDWSTTYLNDAGTLAEVEVWVVGGETGKLFARKARGGVDRGSTVGNTHKGTETNAAKLAFARLGVGHEVYIGLTDLDPDVSEEAAEAQAQGGDGSSVDRSSTLVSAEQAENLRKAVDEAGLGQHLDMKLRSFGVDAIEKLTVEQGLGLWQWSQGGES